MERGLGGANALVSCVATPPLACPRAPRARRARVRCPRRRGAQGERTLRSSSRPTTQRSSLRPACRVGACRPLEEDSASSASVSS